jgi:hypothetical protein
VFKILSNVSGLVISHSIGIKRFSSRFVVIFGGLSEAEEEERVRSLS